VKSSVTADANHIYSTAYLSAIGVLLSEVISYCRCESYILNCISFRN